ncbi:MAG: XRE family transcriptional regulator [Microcystis aeruginosa Ma_QC_Ch_20071001_S25]|jgi:transcriptional regulator with XRE-family HTH domain|nr:MULTISPECIES: helix-turn-helix transcriptional regulator [Microcystis]MCU7242696.1 helix-turn-helix domain-containing protein [Microcystis aeruginosa WS75]NCQ84611.1 helix-turn-helix transcriptional regulator [Microcystis aeruginosa W13-18]NCR06992.1 helix-turn-helix transcriptional regulator [Microcystis aeruginosa LG13-11]NCR35533.1 helix-turn-helix transcriptional regulator [Microcystis aeruginosa S11-05]NCR49025.1 helix-turn-helix transcriptional regulator [Microcystis aeruginosa S11-01
MAKDNLAQFGRCLHNARIQKGLSQERLAEAANLDRTYISLLERGKRNPSLLCLISLCRALNISLSELFNTMSINSDVNTDDVRRFD